MSKETYTIFSWNVNGIRAILKKGTLQKLLAEKNPDVICLQEVKGTPDQVPESDSNLLLCCNPLWNPAKRPGYSGTAVLIKNESWTNDPKEAESDPKKAPLDSWSGMDEYLEISQNWSDDSYGSPLDEGRVLTVEYDRFFLVTVYTPNSKRDLSRLKMREQLWDPSFLKYLKDLEKKKPVVVCGDFNAAHTELDLARPKENERNAGYTIEERRGIENLLEAGFIDTFRELHPKEKRYTWWSYFGHARENNIGWRIDYFFISKSLRKNLKSAEIYEDVTGSDHCPISITLEFSQSNNDHGQIRDISRVDCH